LSWDPTWEEVFRTRGWSRYPLEALISFVARHYFKAANRRELRFLELGCGEGNNLWFLAREGFTAYGVDGSSTAIGKARTRLEAEGLSAHLQVGDVLNLDQLYAGARFDAVINAGCLQHNTVASVEKILSQIAALLEPGGRIFSTMIAAGSFGDQLGDRIEDGTYANIREGSFKGLGLCHFFTLDEIAELFSEFSELQIESLKTTTNNRTQEYTHWIVEGLKP